MDDENEIVLVEDVGAAGKPKRVWTRRSRKPWTPESLATMEAGELVEAILLAAYGTHWRKSAPRILGVTTSYLHKVIAGERTVTPKVKESLLAFCRSESGRVLAEANDRATKLADMWMTVKQGGLDAPKK